VGLEVNSAQTDTERHDFGLGGVFFVFCDKTWFGPSTLKNDLHHTPVVAHPCRGCVWVNKGHRVWRRSGMGVNSGQAHINEACFWVCFLFGKNGHLLSSNSLKNDAIHTPEVCPSMPRVGDDIMGAVVGRRSGFGGQQRAN
jgi:hypothetical protein